MADPDVMMMVVLGTVLGIFVGALPGISGSTTIALMLPMTIAMGPIPAICFLGASIARRVSAAPSRLSW